MKNKNFKLFWSQKAAHSKLEWLIKLYRMGRRLYRSKFIRFGVCNICGHPTVFIGSNAFTLTKKKYRNDLSCIFCNSKARNRAVAAMILNLNLGVHKSLAKLRNSYAFRQLRIYNATTSGSIHQYLSHLPNYFCSEYFPDVSPGTSVMHNGAIVHCEDLERLSFAENSFDLIITEDVLEHVRHPNTALKEIWRVLEEYGMLIFTVPIYGDKTVKRVDTSGDADVFLLPLLYHGDPLRKKGALAYNDFGTDIIEIVAAQGFQVELADFNSVDKRWLCADVIVAKKLPVAENTAFKL